MKKILLTSLIITIALISCKKETSTGGGSFTINGTTYDVTSSTRITSANIVCLTFTNLNSQTFENRTINFYFPGTSTPSAGSYSFVSSSAGMSAGQVYFLATSSNGMGSPTEFSSDGVSGNISVTVNSNKVTVSMSSTNMTITGGGTGAISASVTEM